LIFSRIGAEFIAFPKIGEGGPALLVDEDEIE